MNNKCINFKLRTKKGQRYFYCSRKQDVIEISDYYGCIYKKDKTDNSNNCIILCNHCHLEVVHKIINTGERN